MNDLPGYVSIVFILTTFTAVGFLVQAIKNVGTFRLPSKILIFLLPLWLLFQAILAAGGFYQVTDSVPPRIALLGAFPAALLIAAFFTFFRSSFIERIPLSLLTLLHVIRIPVELVLYWLFLGGLVPKVMTFAGWNFDIGSGILAAIVYFLPIAYPAKFRRTVLYRKVLIVFNVIGLLLLVNIVSIAILSLPTPMQQFGFEQPNRGVLFFPFAYLPTVVVPIVLFAHLAALWKLFSNSDD